MRRKQGQDRRGAAGARKLTSPQPARRPVRRPPRRVTALAPGDVLAFRAPSGRFHLLAVRAVAENRYGVFPLVRLLDSCQAQLPSAGQMSQLADQPAGRGAAAGHPAGPWWCIEGLVWHTRGHDFTDHGFAVGGHLTVPSNIEQQKI